LKSTPVEQCFSLDLKGQRIPFFIVPKAAVSSRFSAFTKPDNP